MNAKWSGILALVLFTVVALAGCTPATPQPTATPSPTITPPTRTDVIRLTNGEWLPYLSETVPHYGPWSHVVSAAFALEGVTIEWGFFPWNRNIYYVETGEWDGSVGWSTTPERQQFALYPTIPLATSCDVIFHHVDYPFDWETIDDLVGHRIGVLLGYAITEQLETAQQDGLNLTLDPSVDEMANLRKLLAGRVDLIHCPQMVCEKLLQENFTPEEAAALTYHPTPWRCADYYLLISKDSPQADHWVETFDRGMQKLIDNGGYDQIFRDFVDGAYDAP